MRAQKFVLMGLCFVVTNGAQAALEYLRFAGIAHEPCTQCGSPFADLGLRDGQFVYFDIAVDTASDAPGYNDSTYRDYFLAIALDGTALAGTPFAASPLAGRTDTFPEGRVSQFFGFGDGLLLGTIFDSLPYDGSADLSIDNWTTGARVSLFAPYQDGSQAQLLSIVRLTLTYRGATPPSAPIPLPAAGWLLLAALGGLRLIAKLPVHKSR